jgi:hypothetical protein
MYPCMQAALGPRGIATLSANLEKWLHCSYPYLHAVLHIYYYIVLMTLTYRVQELLVVRTLQRCSA